MKIKKGFPELIGHTPLVNLERFAAHHNINCTILGKLEFMNPAGSVKDRVAWNMIQEAEFRGLLKPGATIIEPTSGNTGIGLAAAAAYLGYKMILTMPDSMSQERRVLAQAYGAEVVLTEGAKGMAGAIEKAKELASQLPGAFIPGQFSNPANPEAHRLTTGPELWEDTQGRLDALVSCVGTGGTVTGVGTYLREKNPEIKVFAVEPSGSPLLSGGKVGPHKIQGTGANFIPEILDTAAYNEVLQVTDAEAYTMTKLFPRLEGLLVGISSGAALCAALKVARMEGMAQKQIAVILPDTGERYLSTPVFE